MNIRRAALPAVVVSLALLSGCAPSMPSIPGSLEDVVEQVTGGAVDVGGNTSVPSDWPGLPLPQGNLVTVLSVAGTFSLTYEIADEGVANALLAELAGAGFVEEAEADYGTFKSYFVSRDDYTVTIGVTIDKSVGLLYTVTPKG